MKCDVEWRVFKAGVIVAGCAITETLQKSEEKPPVIVIQASANSLQAIEIMPDNKGKIVIPVPAQVSLAPAPAPFI